mmetsp:Transcript_41057/g.85700  ORF Transcript_41057/g.85700 Transcript_41057/m.85700 type:complete len:212 (+) Transcript_41057:1414-2049(+)
MIILRAHEETSANNHLRTFAEVISLVMLAVTLEITGSGITTADHETEPSCLDAIQDKTSGGATIRIAPIQRKTIDTATSAAMTASRLSIDTEISAILLNRPDIMEDIPGVMPTTIRALSSIRLNVPRRWYNITDGRAKFSAIMKIRSAGEFISANLDLTLHLQGQVVIRSLYSPIMTANQTSSRVFNPYRLLGPRPQTVSDVTRYTTTKFI